MADVALTKIDVSTPVVVFRSETYAALGIFRSLGRLGVKVFGIDSSQAAYGLRSRYCSGGFVWDFDGRPAQESIAFLKSVSQSVGGRPVLLPNFDTRTLLVAEHADELRQYFVFPTAAAGAHRKLYDKREMYRLCQEQGVPTAETLFPQSEAEFEQYAGQLRFPLILKAIDGDRLMRRSADGLRMKIVQNIEDLRASFRAMHEPGFLNLMLQEFIPGREDNLWMLAAYFDRDGECRFALTGRKLRQYPVHGGVTSLGVCDPCDAILEGTQKLVRAVGYSGIVSVDCRYDERDSRFKILDVNPRAGANFRLFVDGHGLDVVRTLYLDMTGQAVPSVVPVWGRRYLVEDKDLASSFRNWREGRLRVSDWCKSLKGIAETAHISRDDWKPSLCFLGNLVWNVVTWVFTSILDLAV